MFGGSGWYSSGLQYGLFLQSKSFLLVNICNFITMQLIFPYPFFSFYLSSQCCEEATKNRGCSCKVSGYENWADMCTLPHWLYFSIVIFPGWLNNELVKMRSLNQPSSASELPLETPLPRSIRKVLLSVHPKSSVNWASITRCSSRHCWQNSTLFNRFDPCRIVQSHKPFSY